MGGYGRDQGNSGKKDLVGVCWCRKNHLGGDVPEGLSGLSDAPGHGTPLLRGLVALSKLATSL